MAPLSLRARLRLQNLAFLLLFGLAVGLLAWLSTRYAFQADWSAGARNTLSAASRELLARLPGPVEITAFARPNSFLRQSIRTLVGRYQRFKPDLALAFINPDAAPDRVRELGIGQDGELYLEYRGRGEHLRRLNEQELTQALLRLSRGGERRVWFLEGHGERNPLGKANHDLGLFGRELERTGVVIQRLNPARQPQLGNSAAALVIASPQVRLLPGEVQRILAYLEQGGNLLWLLEPFEDSGLQALTDALGVGPLPGVVVDVDTPWLGSDHPPTFALVADYGPHPVTERLQTLTLFPTAAALKVQPADGWRAETLLLTQSRTWTELGEIDGRIRLDAAQERAGPLPVGVALVRPRPGSAAGSGNTAAFQQRVVVVGDGDFLSNTYLGNGGNLDLGLNMLNWLAQDDGLIAIHAHSAPDRTLVLSNPARLLIGGGFLLLLPAALLGSGGWIWWRRRRR